MITGSIPIQIKDLAYTNCVYISPNIYKDLPSALNINNEMVYNVKTHDSIEHGVIAMNKAQRKSLKVSIGDIVTITDYEEIPDLVDVNLNISYAYNRHLPDKPIIRHSELANSILVKFNGHVITEGQEICMDNNGILIILTVLQEQRTIIHETTTIRITSDSNRVTLVEDMSPNILFKNGFNFEKHGIGGLDDEAEKVFRRAFLSRMFPQSQIEELGIKHVKGIILYGPPGTGKTLMARQIGKMLNSVKPVIVSGPELLNKYVGESESNVRNLFKAAETEYLKQGNNSRLHLIILDEIDAIVKKRGLGGDNTGTKDNIVNQLLSKIDGINSLNNLLLIGTTNRVDLIDPAILRPGRFEIQIETKLPNNYGRQQIFNIHTRELLNKGVLDLDIDIKEMADKTENYTGAEIEGLIKAATSHAMRRLVDDEDMSKLKSNEIKVTSNDLLSALEDILPAFGHGNDIEPKIINYGENWEMHINSFKKYVLSLNGSINNRSLLLTGNNKSGKCNAAKYIAALTKFPFVRMISGDNIIGLSVNLVVNYIKDIFEDAHRSKSSVIILKDILDLIGYNNVGPRFSDTILQTIKRLIKKTPPSGNKILVIGTCSKPEYLAWLETLNDWDIVHEIRELNIYESTIALSEMGLSQSEIMKASDLLPENIEIGILTAIVDMINTNKDCTWKSAIDCLVKIKN